MLKINSYCDFQYLQDHIQNKFRVVFDEVDFFKAITDYDSEDDRRFTPWPFIMVTKQVEFFGKDNTTLDSDDWRLRDILTIDENSGKPDGYYNGLPPWDLSNITRALVTAKYGGPQQGDGVRFPMKMRVPQETIRSEEIYAHLYSADTNEEYFYFQEDKSEKRALILFKFVKIEMNLITLPPNLAEIAQNIPDKTNYGQDRKSVTATENPFKKFHDNTNLRWPDVSVAFIDHDMVEFGANGELIKMQVGEVYLKDRRTGKYNQKYQYLVGLAEKDAPVKFQPQMKEKQRPMSDLRKWLREIFGIHKLKGDPFGENWKPVFALKFEFDRTQLRKEKDERKSGKRVTYDHDTMNYVDWQIREKEESLEKTDTVNLEELDEDSHPTVLTVDEFFARQSNEEDYDE